MAISTDDYVAIPAEMKFVAAQFGKSALREEDPPEFEKNIAKARAPWAIAGAACDALL